MTSGDFIPGPNGPIALVGLRAGWAGGLPEPGASDSGAELDPVAINAGRLAGRVETLLWAQVELEALIRDTAAADRFADTRGLELFLDRVRDSLSRVQDGSGSWAGLVRTVLGEPETPAGEGTVPPDAEMGG